MNIKTQIFSFIIALILCILAGFFLSSCAPKPEGKVMGHGWDGQNYYLILATDCGEGCVEGLPYKVTEEEYSSYKTGDFYGKVSKEEKTIVGKGADGSGNTWLIVSSCASCEQERIDVPETDSYEIGDKLP